MPIIPIVTSPVVSSSNPTVQNVTDAVERDAVNLLGSSSTTLIDYVNRIHLELLRVSRWRFLESEPVQFTTVANSGKYWLINGSAPSGVVDSGLALTDLDIIKTNSVVNRTTNYQLYPSRMQPINQYFLNANYPTEWVLHPTGQLDLWPVPDNAYVIEFSYYKARPTLALSTDVLSIPKQYFDIIVAGVNYLTTFYLAKDNPQLRGDVAFWRGIYEDGKRQMVRDANLFPRVDFIAPDGTSQRSAQTTVSIETSLP